MESTKKENLHRKTNAYVRFNNDIVAALISFVLYDIHIRRQVILLSVPNPIHCRLHVNG